MTKKAEKKVTEVPSEPVEAPEITEVKTQIGWLKTELRRLESLLPEPVVYKSWYSSPAVWLALILVILMIAMISIFYLTESGLSVKILNMTISKMGIHF